MVQDMLYPQRHSFSAFPWGSCVFDDGSVGDLKGCWEWVFAAHQNYLLLVGCPIVEESVYNPRKILSFLKYLYGMWCCPTSCIQRMNWSAPL